MLDNKTPKTRLDGSLPKHMTYERVFGCQKHFFGEGTRQKKYRRGISSSKTNKYIREKKPNSQRQRIFIPRDKEILPHSFVTTTTTMTYILAVAMLKTQNASAYPISCVVYVCVPSPRVTVATR
jgi:hypothetical protein